MPRYLILIVLGLAAAGCAARQQIPVAAASGRPGYAVEGRVFAFQPTQDDARKAAVAQVASACPNGADATDVTMQPSSMTFGYITSDYRATVVCR